MTCRMVLGVSASGVYSGASGVVSRGGGNVLRTTSNTISGLYGIRPVFFHAETIVVLLNALARNVLNAAKNSVLEKVSSPVEIASLTASE